MGFGKLTGAYRLIHEGNYVAAGGKDLFVFYANGQLVMHREDFYQIHAMAFLPDENFLVGDSKKFELVSLKTGLTVWSIPRFKRDYSHFHFAISPSFEFAYTIDMRRDTPFALKINLANGELSAYRVNNVMRCTSDFMCGPDRKLYLLQCQCNESSHEIFGETCILSADLESNVARPRFFVEHNVRFVGTRVGHSFLNSTESILTNDLQVYSTLNEESFSVVENSSNFSFPLQAPSYCLLDASGRYLQISYMGEKTCVLIGLKERKVVAQYALPERIPGCLVGNKFWVCEKNDIVCKPFPSWESLPPKKLTPMF